ncbi:MBL fold metallo-hydrolase [Vibrio cholerae]|uniref:MBL fold metallo-hydrolase n=1 Tax=Vibrio cholerae TaxID=666 RepID=UPI00115978CF|nr:MBL fold metallo-hydrolase [Vibrio cholerae]EJL6536512.1 MBL fold metallo-hydrolase [Vibrio cholerae]EJL6756831.1 MBL fold metallo-hydrolase [Vibrio cholerae]TQP08676.1 MBL fold metallo-hydrolase [Vibrio cholerae]TQP25350.1 MBL fold metallo-hydrolase [Vibrio cholerae]TQP33736.1 MBL fold metallo-hydrolase [Vibrio cholerae]
MLKVIMYKADNGDCISIESQSKFVLVDGGTAQSFSNWKSNIVDQKKVDSVIVTHIDNDHVNGIIKLLQSNSCPEIDHFYFNGAEQLFGQLNDTDEQDRMSDTKLRAISEELSIAGNRDQIGYSEGSSLSYLIMDKNITSNPSVGGAILCREHCDSFSIGDMKFSVIGPSMSVLQELKNHWEDKLSERSIRPRIISKAYYEAFELYAKALQEAVSNATPIASTKETSIESLANVEFEDDISVTNKSSLSFLIESNSKRLLYLSDCDAGVVISWLNNLGLEKIEVDAVKISHHGSKNNTSLELLNRIVCQKYLISTNGKSHSHPDLEVLARIAVVNKGSGAEIFMNYEVEQIPDWFTNQLETNYPNIKLSMDSCEVDL